MMKITFVLPGTGHSVTGGMRVVFEYANRLKDRGHEVNVIYPLILPVIKPKFSLRSMRNQIVGALKNLKIGNKVYWFDLKANLVRIPTISPRFVKLVEKLIPDADIVVATAWETAYFVSKLSEKKGKKFYFVQHYEIWDVWNNEECWKEAEKIERDADKLCLAMCDVIPKGKELRNMKDLVDRTYKMPLRKITISSWLKELIEKKFGGEVDGVIINGVDFETFHTEGDVYKKGTIRILMPYRPTEWKGTEDGLKALSMVREKYPDVEFVMYGANRGKEVPEWIKFHENVPDDELRKLYNSSDIFVLPSWVEGSQLPPMEAMACGCAVVATNVGGIPDYTIPGKTAMVSPPRNPEGLARNIIKLLRDEKELKRVSKAGYEYIRQFTWEKATDQLERIFLKCINNDASLE